MQTIKHEAGHSYAHPVFSKMELMYRYTCDRDSVSDNQLIAPVFNRPFENIQNMFNDYGETHYNFRFTDSPITKLKPFAYDSKNMIVCVSGGKDSLSAVLHYQKLGYNVYLYHLHGVNRYCYDEYIIVQKLASVLHLPCIIESVTIQGKHDWVEHPMKNMLIATMALNYGIQHDITTKIAFGNFRTSSVVDEDFSVCSGDCTEMWEAYESVIKQIIPKFKVYIANLNYTTSFKALKTNSSLLPYTMSCMAQKRFRVQFKHRTESMYDVQLMPNRCGCCWKCALEYIWFCDAGVLEFNLPYYIHCLELLIVDFERNHGIVPNLRYLWDSYMFYPMKKSSAWKEIQNAIISTNGKIKSTDNTFKG